MPDIFYSYIDSDYNGSEIIVTVERDTSSFESTSGPVSLSNVRGYIDGVEKINEDDPLFAIDGRAGLGERLPQLVQILENEVDAHDEFSEVMEEVGFDGSESEPIVGYTATAGPGSGQITHNWTNDPDIDIEALDQADDVDFTVNLVTIHSGSLTPPFTDSGYTPSVQKFFRIRGERTGADPGPWSYGDATPT